MTASKLPGRPSMESLRKQAKKLARGIAAGDAAAIDRARPIEFRIAFRNEIAVEVCDVAV